MKQLLFLMSLLSVISIYSYAFVHGSKSDLDAVRIFVYGHGYMDADHSNVKRGNKGRGAEWNWRDIEKDKGIKKGDKMRFIITRGGNPNMRPRGVLYHGEIASDGLFGFIVKHSKDPRTNADVYTVVPDQEAANEYRPV